MLGGGALGAPAPALAAGADSPLDPPAAVSMGQAIAAQLERNDVTSAAYAIVTPTGIEAHGHGAATADTPFVIGSVSKSFTATLVLDLAEDGLVDLEAPIGAYLEEFRAAGTGSQITVGELLSQTSGLTDRGLEPLVYEPGHSLGELAAAAAAKAPDGAGTAPFEYANTNFSLAGLVAERAAGAGYEELLRERILEPLGMAL